VGSSVAQHDLSVTSTCHRPCISPAVITKDAESAKKVESQLKATARGMYR